MKLPRIGKRMLKSILAMFICLVLSFFHQSKEMLLLSMMAALISVQQDSKNAYQFAIKQIVALMLATIIGALLLIITIHFTLPWMYDVCFFAIAIFLLMYGLIVIHCSSGMYLSILLLLVLVLGQDNYYMSIIYFVNTLLGVVIACVINLFHLPYKPQKDIMFVCGLDNCLLNSEGKISPFTKLKLNEVLEKDANIVIATSRSVGNLFQLVDGIAIKQPVVCLNGAAIYDLNQQEYIKVNYIDEKLMNKMNALLDQYQMNAFTHVLQYDMLYVYYQNLDDIVVSSYYHQVRKNPYDHYVYQDKRLEQKVVYLKVLDKSDRINALIEEMKQKGIYYEFNIAVKPYENDYEMLEIGDKNAGKKMAVKYLYQQSKAKRLYVFGSDIQDIELMGYANRSFVVRNGVKALFDYGEVINSNDENGVVVKLQQLFLYQNKESKS